MTLRLGVLASHPIQYHAPLFRELARRVDLQVYFAHRQTTQQQAAAGFNVAFDWDVDLLDGYPHEFLVNRARQPGVNAFFGCHTPEIRGRVRDGNFDAFLVMGWHLRSYWQAIRACRRFGVPVMVRGDSHLGTQRSRLKQSVKALLYPQLLRQFDACLYVGLKNRAYLRHYGVSQAQLFFSPHCVDTHAFFEAAATVDRNPRRAELGLGATARVVLFVGKMMEHKRPHDLLRALQVMRRQGENVCALFVGDGPLRKNLERTAQTLGVPAVFPGFRNQSQLPESYVMADVLVLPSDGETWGLVVNEALACGTPVVVSDAVGCAPDLVTEGETGSVYAVGDVEELARALARGLQIPRNTPAIAARSEAYSVGKAAQGIVNAAITLKGQG